MQFHITSSSNIFSLQCCCRKQVCSSTFRYVAIERQCERSLFIIIHDKFLIQLCCAKSNNIRFIRLNLQPRYTSDLISLYI